MCTGANQPCHNGKCQRVTHAAFKTGFKQSESAGCWRAEQVVQRRPAARRRTARRPVVKTPHRHRPDARNIAAHVKASDPFVPRGLKLFNSTVGRRCGGGHVYNRRVAFLHLVAFRMCLCVLLLCFYCIYTVFSLELLLLEPKCP